MNDSAPYFKHDTAIVESPSVGRGTRVWAYAHILPGAVIGSECNICDHTFIENDVRIGDRVTIKCGVQVWDGVWIEDDVFVGPNATFSNDSHPRSQKRPETYERTLVKRGASIGANATILPGTTIGERAMIGAGAVVTRDVPPLAVVTGNPARIVGYEGTGVREAVPARVAPDREGATATRVRGVTIHRLPEVIDLRGSLTFGEAENQVPFPIRRFFIVYDVPSREIRGEHAHKTLHQFLVCLRGKCHVVADDGVEREEFVLDHPTLGLYLPPMTWGIQYQYTEDAVLAVFASDRYDATSYIRDYSEFLALAAAR